MSELIRKKLVFYTIIEYIIIIPLTLRLLYCSTLLITEKSHDIKPERCFIK